MSALFALMVLFGACETDEQTTLGSSSKSIGMIEVYVKHLFDRVTLSDSLVPEVSIELYDDRETFVNQIEPRASRKTDSSGTVQIHFLSPGYYYLIAQDDSLGSLIDSVSLPDNALKAVVEFIYL